MKLEVEHGSGTGRFVNAVSSWTDTRLGGNPGESLPRFRNDLSRGERDSQIICILSSIISLLAPAEVSAILKHPSIIKI